MRSRNVTNGYILRLERGEELVTVLTAFCQQQGIEAGFLSGLGGATSASLGYYDLKTREYSFRQLDNLREIANLTGNVALKDGAPFLHIHATLADSDLRTFSGHVKSLTVAGTCEVYLAVFDEPLVRAPDAASGLSLLDL